MGWRWIMEDEERDEWWMVRTAEERARRRRRDALLNLTMFCVVVLAVGYLVWVA